MAPKTLEFVIDSLATSSFVRTLALVKAHFTKDSVAKLSEYIRDSRFLRALDLSYNNLTAL